MKNFSILFLLAAILVAALPLRAQIANPGCSTPPPVRLTTPDVPAERSLLAGPFVFQIFVHILRDDDGSNAAMTEANMLANMLDMASFFQPHDICFVLVGWDFIDNTLWNSNYTTAEINNLHAVNAHSNAIDIYVHRLNFESSGGNSYAIPSDKNSVSAQTWFNFEHEMGHCLGLWHTFENVAGDECPDGSNCGSGGDQVCDTPADFGGSQNSSTGCTYTGTQTISCNSNTFTYSPPTNNIMSYWAGCYAQFTAGQRTRMENTINGTTFLQDRLAPADRIITGTTFTGEMAFGAVETITIGDVLLGGDVLMHVNARGVYNAGESVRILPGTRVEPTGARSIVFRINDLCTGVAPASIAQEGQDGAQPAPDANPNTAGAAVADAVAVAPNPFTGSTMIRYTLGQPRTVDVQVFSATGARVAYPIENEWREAGNYEVRFDAGQLPAGLYRLVVRLDGERISKAIVLAH
jgi:hypothetical protein